jgi:pectinesterase
MRALTRRAFVGSSVGGAVAACLGTPSDAPAYDALVSRHATAGRVPVFRSVQAALDAAPANGERVFHIHVERGRWREKLTIDKPGQRRPDGEPWGTWGCASMTVRAGRFRASSLTIENAFDYIGNLRAPQFEAIGPNGAQAVALMLDAGSQAALVEDVEILGHQDSLFVDAGRSRFRRCFVAGSVDFVFGAGAALFEDCELQSRFRPDKPRQGYVAAPSTPLAQDVGLVFLRCRLTREAQVPARSVVLGRAWRPTREFPDGRYGDPAAVGSAVFARCWMDEHIAAQGWESMNYTARDGTRVALTPAQARLFEFENTGPGAIADAHRRVLSAQEARRYLELPAAWTFGATGTASRSQREASKAARVGASVG